MIFSDAWFYVRILGGEWTNAHYHSDANAASMFAREPVKSFCTKYKMPKQKGFCSVGTPKLVRTFSQQSGHTGLAFFELFVENCSEPGFRYSAEQFDSYVPSEEFLDWAIELDVESSCFAAVMELNRFAKPTNPVA